MDRQSATRSLGLRDKQGNLVSLGSVFGTERWSVSFVKLDDKFQRCFESLGVNAECLPVPTGSTPPSGSIVFYNAKGDVSAWATAGARSRARAPAPTRASMRSIDPKRADPPPPPLDMFPRAPKSKKKKKKKKPVVEPVTMTMLKDELLEAAAKLNLDVDDTWTKAELVELVNSEIGD